MTKIKLLSPVEVYSWVTSLDPKKSKFLHKFTPPIFYKFIETNIRQPILWKFILCQYFGHFPTHFDDSFNLDNIQKDSMSFFFQAIMDQKDPRKGRRDKTLTSTGPRLMTARVGCCSCRVCFSEQGRERAFVQNCGGGSIDWGYGGGVIAVTWYAKYKSIVSPLNLKSSHYTKLPTKRSFLSFCEKPVQNCTLMNANSTLLM